jgi:phosphoglycerate transport regulatory protein PgtC
LDQRDGRAKLAEARRMLGVPPVSADDATLLLEELEAEAPRGILRTPRQEAFVRDMRSMVEHNFATIENLLASISTTAGN